MRKFVLFAMTLTVFQGLWMAAGLGIVKAAAAPQAGDITAQNVPVLANSTRLTVNGTPAGPGECTFVPPRLTLAPNETAIQADEVSVNTTTCTSVWQVGTPTDLTRPSGPNYSSATQFAKPGSLKTAGMARPDAVASLNSSSGYTYAWISDAVGATTTSDQTNIAWAWDGRATWWWLSETGWQSPSNNGVWIARYCVWSEVWSQADFYNPYFCSPTIVFAHYRGVSVRGWGNGYMDGWVDNMWTQNSCFPLFTNYRVVRTV
jgi:hypothetical protein